MARIPRAVIARVQSRTNIVNLIGHYLHLSRSGKNLFAHCPFHEDHTPSFSVSPSKQIFHCFSCGRGGNVFQFLMDYKHLSFPQSIVAVAQFDGIHLSNRYLTTRPQRPLDKTVVRLMKIYREATRVYHYILMDTKVGQPALNYLHRRGLSDRTINAYRLGFSPSRPILKQFLSNNQFSRTLMEKSGLFIRDARGHLKDRFFNRVIYPIRDAYGHPIAFSGRVLDKKTSPAKYLNSPETKIFHKRSVLFNLNVARKMVKSTHSLILFEGYMDVMSAYQSGIKNGIASMGTSLTDAQIDKISMVSHKLWVCYDGDLPGQRAIHRALKLLSKTRLQAGVIQMPWGIDPDEYRQKYGEKQFHRYMRTAQETPTTFELNFWKRGLNFNNDRDQMVYLHRAVKIIAAVHNSVRQDVYIRRVAQLVKIPVNDLRQQVTSLSSYQLRHPHHSRPRRFYPHSQVDNVKISVNRVKLAEQALLCRMFTDHNVWLNVTSIKNFTFADTDYQTLYDIANDYFRTHSHYNYQVKDFAAFAEKARLGSLVQQISKLDLPKQISRNEIHDYVKIIMIAPFVRKLKQVRAALGKAANVKNYPEEQRLLSQMIKTKRHLIHSRNEM